VETLHGAVSHFVVLVRKQYEDGRDYDNGIKTAKEEMKAATEISKRIFIILKKKGGGGWGGLNQSYPLHAASGSPSNILC
jgi:hypothetical protein